jgi:hypothetical protein
MRTYAYASLTAALMAASAGVGAGSVVYMRPLQPPQQQQQAISVPQPTPEAPAPSIRTLAWFKTHDAERIAKVAACADNPGVARLGDPECDNAFYARDEISIDAELAKDK